MQMRCIRDGVISTLRMITVGVGLLLYLVSFLGYGWDKGGNLLIAAFVLIFVTSIPTMIRDRRFFLTHWGFGLTRLRSRFPFQFFPARRERWLNTLAWCFMAVLLLHFVWLVSHSPASDSPGANSTANLRYISLMVFISGTLNVLSWDHPPSERPRRFGR